MEYTSHTAVEGDRWDELAYRYLGDSFNISPIIEANPLIPIRTEIPSGSVLFIPVFDPQPLQDFNNLPPWKRPQNG